MANTSKINFEESFRVGDKVVVLTPVSEDVEKACETGEIDEELNFVKRLEKEGRLDFMGLGVVKEIKTGPISDLPKEARWTFDVEGAEYQWILIDYRDMKNNGWGWIRLGKDGAFTAFHESDMEDVEGTPRWIQMAEK